MNNISLRSLISKNELLVLALMVVVALASRFLIETPNFKPIAAFALFGGFFFRKPLVGIVAMLAVLSLSDLRIGFYDWPMMICVYCSIAVSVLLGVAIQKRIGQGKPTTAHWLGFLASSVVMSSVFYLVTNAGVWMSGWYPMSFAGMVECYAAALPFYRWTVLGDLFFTTLTVGSYAAVMYGVEWSHPKPDVKIVVEAS